jgi:hypothetical protein
LDLRRYTEVVVATQPIMLLRCFMQYIPTVGFRVLNKVGPCSLNL